MEQLGFYGAHYRAIWYWCIFRKSAEKMQALKKKEKITGTLHENQHTFIIISR
jgi:hypothetical protein